MIAALNFSLKKNILNKKDYSSIKNHISNLNFSLSIQKFFKLKDLNKIVSFMLKDKKNNSNKINLVLLKKIGFPTINNEYNKQNLNLFLRGQLSN